MLWVIGIALIVSGCALAIAVAGVVDSHLTRSREGTWGKLQHIHGDLASLRKEIKTMAAITGQMLDQILDIANQLLDADPGDKAAIEALQAQVATLTADVEDFNNPDRAARVQAFLDKAAAATPAPGL